jgi:hypothetical protein
MKGGAMENPRATEREQELAQTERNDEEEEMRGATGEPNEPPEAGGDEEP